MAKQHSANCASGQTAKEGAEKIGFWRWGRGITECRKLGSGAKNKKVDGLTKLAPEKRSTLSIRSGVSGTVPDVDSGALGGLLICPFFVTYWQAV